jgi:hypothetical protein
VSFQELTEFLVKGHAPVVLFLPRDVSNHHISPRFADGEIETRGIAPGLMNFTPSGCPTSVSRFVG